MYHFRQVASISKTRYRQYNKHEATDNIVYLLQDTYGRKEFGNNIANCSGGEYEAQDENFYVQGSITRGVDLHALEPL